VPVKGGQLLDEVIRTAGELLIDEEDLVQKGYGWMLKEASLTFPDEVFQFVMDHRGTMPRTALRYAIERYPAVRRKKAMAKMS
jgi:3-methyladenine DNA glycosylase AlkD